MRGWGAFAAVLACVVLAVGCSDGSDSDGASDPVEEPLASAEVAEGIGCDEGDRVTPRIGADTRHCVIDGQWPVIIHASLNARERAAGIRRLDMRYGTELDRRYNPENLRCPDGSPRDPVVVAGDTWIVVASDRAAGLVTDRVGGEVQPSEERGPIVSYESPLGGFCRR